jgi:hypothetical protein
MTHGIGLGKKVTSHPSVQDKLVAGGYQYSEQIACKDGVFFVLHIFFSLYCLVGHLLNLFGGKGGG